MSGFVYLPGTDGSFVELSRTKSGKMFRKHILSTGDLNYPGVKGGKVHIDDEFLATLKANFDNKVCDIVQVPVAGAHNEHTENPFSNIGEVVDLQIDGGKAYAYIDARDEIAASKLGKTLLGASAMLSLDYLDTRTGEKMGPTLLHVAVTNRPHIVELEEYEELLAASADSSSDAVFLTATLKEKNTMDLDDYLTGLKDEHGIDVPALQRAAADAANVTSLSNTIQAALVDSGVLTLSNADEVTSSDDLVAAVAQIAADRVELSAKVDALVEDSAKKAAESRVDALISEGFIAPVKRDANIKLLLSNAETFEELLPEKPLVMLSQEAGQEPLDETPSDVVDAEIARLSAVGQAEGVIHA